MAEEQNVVVWVPVGVNNPSVGGWIVWPLVIQHNQKNLIKYWDLGDTSQQIQIPSRTKLATVS